MIDRHNFQDPKVSYELVLLGEEQGVKITYTKKIGAVDFNISLFYRVGDFEKVLYFETKYQNFSVDIQLPTGKSLSEEYALAQINQHLIMDLMERSPSLIRNYLRETKETLAELGRTLKTKKREGK